MQRYAVWYGGSLLGSLPDFYSYCYNKQDYEEHGPSIVRDPIAIPPRQSRPVSVLESSPCSLLILHLSLPGPKIQRVRWRLRNKATSPPSIETGIAQILDERQVNLRCELKLVCEQSEHPARRSVTEWARDRELRFATPTRVCSPSDRQQRHTGRDSQ